MRLLTRKPLILVVDDIPANVEMLGEALQDDYEIQFATSGARALQLAMEEAPDLVLLDIMMPEMDGFQTLDHLRALPGLAQVHVIFVTALDKGSAEADGLSLGAADYITKPINVKIARLRIRNLLERERLRTELALSLSGGEQGLWECNLQKRTMRLDPDWCAPLGYSPGEFSPSTVAWQTIIHPEHLDALTFSCEAHLEHAARAIELDLRMRNRRGTWNWITLRGRLVEHDDDGQPLRAKGVFFDISRRKSMEQELIHLANTDFLTQVANRRRFMQELESELARVSRYGGSACLLMVDLDRFKAINDHSGHAGGDSVLRHFAATARQSLRTVDVVGRIGGEEFAILLPATELEGAANFGERLRAAVASEPAQTRRGPVAYTVSIGVTDLAPDDGDTDTVLARADVALYAAKADGRNRISVHRARDGNPLPARDTPDGITD